MVAKMASCGAARHLEEGDGDVPSLEDKACVNNNLAESDSSSSENTEASTEESSDEDNSEDSDGCGEKDEGGGETEANKNSVHELNPGADAEVFNGKEQAFFKVCCEKCKAIRQSQGHELITPRRMSKGQLQVLLEDEGTYECSVTGLVFEVSERVQVQYSVLSWSKFGNLLPDSWKFAGPIFNVDTINKEAAVLKSIQFPHSLCLPDREKEMTFGVLHIKGNRPLVEPTVDHSNSHVTWRVTSLSPVGPIIQSNQSVEHHGVVLVYRQLSSDSNNYSFHIYLATNSSSDIKDIAKQVRSYKNRYIKIEKPPTCKLEECTYRLLSDPEGEIKPENLKFTLAVTKMKGYFEAFFDHPPPFKLSLIEMDSEQTVWSATIREGDCADNAEQRPKKRTMSQRSNSPSEEEFVCKKPKWKDESDGVKTVKTQSADMSEKQLLQVAKRLGKEWKQVAIYLDLSSRELEDIQATEKDVIMQKLKMLVEWKSRRRPGEATACHLLKSVEDLDDLPTEVHQTLQDMMKNERL